MTIELSEYVIDAIADAVVKKMQDPSYNSIKTELEPCDDAISRQAVIEILNDAYFLKLDDGAALQESVKQLPPVTPQPKMGYWEWNQYDANPKIGNFHCSLCHSIGRTYFDYCPYCGAKMSEIPTGAEGSEKE